MVSLRTDRNATANVPRNRTHGNIRCVLLRTAASPIFLPAQLTAAFSRSKTIEDLSHICSTNWDALNHIHISAAMSAAVKLHGARCAGAASLLDALSLLFGQKLSDATIREVSTVLWSMAKLARPPPRMLLSHILAAQQRRDLLRAASPQALANILWALATWRTRGPDPLLSLLLQCCCQALPAFSPQDTANVLWALARLSQSTEPLPLPKPLLPGLLAAAASQVAAMKPQGLAISVWACHRLNQRHTAFLRAAAAAFRAKLPAASPTDMALMAASLAGLRFRCPAFLRAVAERCCENAEFNSGSNRGSPGASVLPSSSVVAAAPAPGPGPGPQAGGEWSPFCRQRILWAFASLQFRHPAAVRALLLGAAASQGPSAAATADEDIDEGEEEEQEAGPDSLLFSGRWSSSSSSWIWEPGGSVTWKSDGHQEYDDFDGRDVSNGGGGDGAGISAAQAASSLIWCMGRLGCGRDLGREQRLVLAAAEHLWAVRRSATLRDVAMASWGLERLGLSLGPGQERLLRLACERLQQALDHRRPPSWTHHRPQPGVSHSRMALNATANTNANTNARAPCGQTGAPGGDGYHAGHAASGSSVGQGAGVRKAAAAAAPSAPVATAAPAGSGAEERVAEDDKLGRYWGGGWQFAIGKAAVGSNGCGGEGGCGGGGGGGGGGEDHIAVAPGPSLRDAKPPCTPLSAANPNSASPATEVDLNPGELDAAVMVLWCLGRRGPLTAVAGAATTATTATPGAAAAGAAAIAAAVDADADAAVDATGVAGGPAAAAAESRLLDTFSEAAPRLLPRLSVRQLPLVCCAYMQLGRSDPEVLGGAVELLMGRKRDQRVKGRGQWQEPHPPGGVSSVRVFPGVDRGPSDGRAMEVAGLGHCGVPHVPCDKEEEGVEGMVNARQVNVKADRSTLRRQQAGGFFDDDDDDDDGGGGVDVSSRGCDDGDGEGWRLQGWGGEEEEEEAEPGGEGGRAEYSPWPSAVDDGAGSSSSRRSSSSSRRDALSRGDGGKGHQQLLLLSHLPRNSLAMMLWALASTGYATPQLMQRVANQVMRLFPPLPLPPPPPPSAAVSAASGQQHPPPASSSSGSRLQPPAAASSSSSARWAALILWAFAAADCYNATLYDNLLSYVIRRVPRLGPGRAAVVLWSCAVAGHYRRDVLEALSGALRRGMRALPAASFTQANWAIAHLSAGLCLSWPGPASSHLTQLTPHLTCHQAAVLLWTLAVQQLVMATQDKRKFAAAVDMLLAQLAASPPPPPQAQVQPADPQGAGSGGGGGGGDWVVSASGGTLEARWELLQDTEQGSSLDSESELSSDLDRAATAFGLDPGAACHRIQVARGPPSHGAPLEPGVALIAAEAMALLLASPHEAVRARVAAHIPDDAVVTATAATPALAHGSVISQLAVCWQKALRRRHPQQAAVAAAARQLGYSPRLLRTHHSFPLALPCAVELPDAAPKPAVLLLADRSDFATNVKGQPLGPLFTAVQLLRERGWLVAVVVAPQFAALRHHSQQPSSLQARQLRHLLRAAGVSGPVGVRAAAAVAAGPAGLVLGSRPDGCSCTDGSISIDAACCSKRNSRC